MSQDLTNRRTAPHRPAGRVLDLRELRLRQRRRRAWALLVAVPVALFMAAYAAAGGPVLSWWPLIAVAGVLAVLLTVSAVARWSIKRETKQWKR